MDFYNRSPSPKSRSKAVNRSSSDSHRRNSKRRDFAKENDENMNFQNSGKESMNFMSLAISSASKKKILAEKNEAAFFDPSSGDRFRKSSQVISKVASDQLNENFNDRHQSPMVCLSGDRSSHRYNDCDSIPYDPLTNYTSPRPQFLRYNPNKRREILLRIEGEMREEEDGSQSDLSLPSGSNPSSASSASSQTYFQDKEVQETKEEVSDPEDDAVDEKGKSRLVWKILFLLGVFLFLFYFPASMNSGSLPPLQEYGANRESDQKVLDLAVAHRTHETRTLPTNVLGTLMGFSDVCLDVPFRESTCGIEANSSDLIALDGLVETRTLPTNVLGTLMGFSDVCLDVPFRESTCGIEANSSDLIALDGLVESIYLEESESQSEEIELLYENEFVAMDADRNGTWLDLNGVVIYDDLVAPEEKMHEAGDSAESIAQQQCSKETPYDFANEWIEDEETVRSADTNYTDHLTSDSLQASNIHVADDGSLSDQDAALQFRDSLDMEDVSIEKTQASSSAEFAVELRTKKWTHIFVFVSARVFQLLPVFLCFLSSAIGLSGLYKVYLSYKVSSSLLSSPAVPSSQFARGETIISSVPSKEQSDAFHKPLTLSTEPRGLTGMQQPVVEFLGEFSIMEDNVFEKGSAQTSRGREADLAELSQLSHKKGRSTRKNTSSSANKILLSPSETSVAEAVSNGSYAAQKLLSKEDSAERVVKVDQVPTPLRRSTRIRNRINST